MSYSFDGQHATSVRPAHKTSAVIGNWAKDESAPGANDGTRLTASWANRIVAVLRALHTAYDVAYSESDDTILVQAIEAAVAAAIVAQGVVDEDDLATALTAFVNFDDIVDSLTSTASDRPLSANQGRALKALIDGLGDVQVVADLTAAAALTGLDNGDLVHVLDNGSGKWVRYQITTAGDGTWGDATKVVIWTQDQAPTSHTHVANDISDSSAAGRAVLAAADYAAIRTLLGLGGLALLNFSDLAVFTGDSGSGGVKGLVPAPVSGDATKFLRGDGQFATPAGAGDVAGPADSVDNEAVLFSGTSGKVLKRSTLTGLIKQTSGVSSAATAGSDYVKPDTASAFTAQQSVTLATLTDAASIDWAVGTRQKAKVTLAGNRTMNAVTQAVEGATYLLWVIQDATGSRTLSWTTSGAGSFDFGAEGAPTLTTTANKADLLAFEAITIGGTLKLRFCGIRKAFG